MNCEKCQEYISPFLDGELDEASAAMVRSHLIACEPCATLFEEFVSILDNCAGLDADSPMPPNSDALWCRINNILETEVQKRAKVEQPEQAPEERRWDFSFVQIVSAMAGIALISSLLTVVGIRNYLEPQSDAGSALAAESPSVITRLLGKLGLAETPQAARERRLREQQAAIEYWDRRVKMRRAGWDERMRTAFDRNLREIDHAVHEYTLLLEQDPDDALTMEMLDSALDDKMNLLRQFSGL
ncbi:MAG TPA: zf-HC2 domain-containing protein [Pyrinomonadaceae bacterium]|nr:zf-HC2 domain-containing protein [Pyrinomonadaceae bacterium]HMP65286.1 zf-HC2 domain-containing protein [Pyrinomonadaceae bacterium]